MCSIKGNALRRRADSDGAPRECLSFVFPRFTSAQLRLLYICDVCKVRNEYSCSPAGARRISSPPCLFFRTAKCGVETERRVDRTLMRSPVFMRTAEQEQVRWEMIHPRSEEFSHYPRRVSGGGGAESTRASASTCTSRPAAVDAHLHNSLITTPLPACTRPPRLHHCLPRSRLTRTGRRARPQRTDSPFSDRLRLRLLSKSGRGGAAHGFMVEIY